MEAFKIILDIVLSLIIAFLVFLGVKKGIIKSFFKTTKMFFVVMLTLLIGPCIDSVFQNSFVHEMFENGTINVGMSKLISYVLAFVLSYIACTLVISLFERVGEVSVIGWINHSAGIISGLANAYVVTSAIVWIVKLAFGMEFFNGTIIADLIYKIGLFTF